MKIEDLAGLVQKKKGSMGVRAAAAEIGISPTTLSRIERGHVPDMGTLEKVSAWLGQDMERFTGIGDLQIAFKKNRAISPDTAKSLANLIELASSQFAAKIEVEGHQLLRRGFKSQCERRSVEIRKSLGIAHDDPLPSVVLAERIGATIWSEADISGLSAGDLQQLIFTDGESWSAFTLRISNRHLVVFNSSQSRPRKNSVIMHELAHIILGHKLHTASLSSDGHLVPSNYSQDQEDEADWFGGALLLPRPALMRIRRERLTDIQAMEKFEASEEMLKWRIRMTGVDYQLGYARKRVTA